MKMWSSLFSGLLCGRLNRNHNCDDHIFISLVSIWLQIIRIMPHSSKPVLLSSASQSWDGMAFSWPKKCCHDQWKRTYQAWNLLQSIGLMNIIPKAKPFQLLIYASHVARSVSNCYLCHCLCEIPSVRPRIFAMPLNEWWGEIETMTMDRSSDISLRS